MLRGDTLSAGTFSRLLQITGDTLRQRIHEGQLALAFGCRTPAYPGEYLPIDAAHVLLTSKLGRAMGGWKAAAELVIAGWEPLFGAIRCTEDELRLHDPDSPPIPYLYLGVAAEADQPLLGVVGPLAGVLAQLAGCDEMRAISIQTILLELRANAERADVGLPDRLTPPLDYPEIELYRAEVTEHQKLADARYRAKKPNPDRPTVRFDPSLNFERRAA
jgi:hypothetical protein